ncbi:MAG: UbiD family decarboxylase [Desulfobacterales bacterium]|nr:UbiD family decarboxylase [Desulfobacterales bacterium]
MAYYRDLRDYLKVLEEKNKLVRIKSEINKDTELHPLVRWQFRGLPEAERKGFLFENVTDVHGRKYSIPVAVAIHAASREIYGLAMGCGPHEIAEKWTRAQLNPLAPRMVSSGPVQEEIHKGAKLLEHGGMEEFPVPISTPGFDNAPYLTAANWVTKDPETGLRNMGNYRSMVKRENRLGILSRGTQHLRIHWEKSRKAGKPLQAAIVLGPPPNVGLVATAKIAFGVDEYAVAGGLAGEPLELVKCQTVDLEVPATAEIVIEGEMPVDAMETEGAFGEFSGYMGMPGINPFLNITCITHRKKPIFNAFLSQFPPSESSKLRQVGSEAAFYKFLKYDCNISGVRDVAFHESSGSAPYMVIRIKKNFPSEGWQALNGAAAYTATNGKFIILVDEDIDPWDADSVNWAMSFRVQPHRDIRITMGRESSLDPSSAPLEEGDRRYPMPHGCSSILIDATMKWPYPPVSLPRKNFMEEARKIWEREGLPKLSPKTPWYGYSLGYWTEENEAEARLALEGRYYETGDKFGSNKVKS